MKKIILLVSIVLLWLSGAAQDPPYPAAPPAPQNIVRAEYFIDTDPGFGNGMGISLTAGVDLANMNFVVNTTGLSNGPHRLFVRSLSNEGHWSITAIREFLVDFDPAYNTISPPLNVMQMEYFIDSDPGIGNGIAIPVTPAVTINNLPATINTTGLSTGTHRLYIRSRSNEGHWSITNVKEFLMDLDPAYPTPPAAPQNIVSAEYFLNTDPGFGNGVGITLTPGVDLNNVPFSVNTSALVPGSTNRLYVRSLNAEGKWSITHVKEFLVNLDPAYPAAPSPPGNITYAEYFIDTDPGFGNASPITLTPGVDISNLVFTVNTTGLSNGQHKLYVRSYDDWGLTAYTTFNVGSALPLRFITFSVINRPRWVDLQWETADEVNTSHFVVERSIDFRTWTSIGQVTSRNTIGRHAYSARDSLPMNGWNYYRLKQIDNDGRFLYSQILSVNRKTEMVNLFPNPATSEVQVLLKKQVASLRIDLIDAGGRSQKTFTINNPALLIKLPLTDVPAGVYYLRIRSENEEWTERLIKQ
jgi:hypothetical protein